MIIACLVKGLYYQESSQEFYLYWLVMKTYLQLLNLKAFITYFEYKYIYSKAKLGRTGMHFPPSTWAYFVRHYEPDDARRKSYLISHNLYGA